MRTNSLDINEALNPRGTYAPVKQSLSDSFWDTIIEGGIKDLEAKGENLLNQGKDVIKQKLTSTIENAIKTNPNTKNNGSVPTKQEIEAEVEKALARKENGTARPNMKIFDRIKSELVKTGKELKTTSPIITGTLTYLLIDKLGGGTMAKVGGTAAAVVGNRLLNNKMNK